MNGIPVYPLPKNGERPYLAVPAASFLGLFFGYFHLIFYPPPVQHNITPTNLFSATLYSNTTYTLDHNTPGTGYTLTTPSY